MRACLLILALIFTKGFLHAQAPEPPYKQFGVLPGMTLLGMDSTTVYTLSHLPKDKPILVLNFHTTCHHCQAEVEDIVANRNKFRKYRIVMISLESLQAIRDFHEQYGLSALNNLVIGKDHKYTSVSFYTFKRYPFSVLYDKNHRYLSAFEDQTDSRTILDEFKKKQAN